MNKKLREKSKIVVWQIIPIHIMKSQAGTSFVFQSYPGKAVCHKIIGEIGFCRLFLGINFINSLEFIIWCLNRYFFSVEILVF